MIYRRTQLASLEKCYAVSAFPLGGRERFLFASEVKAPCLSFDGEGLSRETIWEDAGGTMARVPLPGKTDAFLAIQNFFPPFAAADSKIVWVERQAAGDYRVEEYLRLPYLHRFGLVTRAGKTWLVLATLCREKANKDDWTKPGSVYAAPLTDSPEDTPVYREILGGQFHNHGFFTGTVCGVNAAAVGSDQGAFLLIPPETGEDWTVRQLTDRPTGEVWLEDLDGDGVQELVTLEAFHGSDLKVYHPDDSGIYREAWRLPEELEFAHALWCGELWGRVCGICGSRRGTAPLLRFFWDGNGYHTELIENGASAANVWVGEHNGEQCLLSANHGQNACVMYTAQES